jgi:hypothetical protein
MTALFVVAALIGVPAIAYFVLSGGDGDFGADGGDAALGISPLVAAAFFLGFFGVGGLVVGALGSGEGARLGAAVALGVIAVVAQTVIFRVVRGSSASSQVRDDELRGLIAHASLPLQPGARGRITLQLGDQRLTFTAALAPGSAPVPQGGTVVIVTVERGIATVAPAPELGP